MELPYKNFAKTVVFSLGMVSILALAPNTAFSQSGVQSARESAVENAGQSGSATSGKVQGTSQPQKSSKSSKPASGYIEEVFVTVSKRTESLQEVSSAVSAFSAQMLAQNNIQDYSTLADMTPGMITKDESNVTIRGIGKGWGGTSPVAFHVNGFFIEEEVEPFYDMEAVEVLRGPSGTVYGRNATAGAINAKWQRPELEFSAGGDYRRATFDDEQLRAFVNVPLIDKSNANVTGRLAAIKSKRRGYLNNLLAPSDKEPNGKDEGFVRAYLKSDVGDKLRLGLRTIYYESDTPAGTAATPSLQTRRSGILERFGAEPLPDDLLKIRSTMFLEQPKPHREFVRVVGEFGYSFTDIPFLGDIDLDMQLGQVREENFTYRDLDGTEAHIAETIEDIDIDRRNGEVRITSQNDLGLDWILGFFWYDSTWQRDMHVDAVTEEGLAALFPQIAVVPLPEFVLSADVDFIDEQRVDKSKALFMNFRLDLEQLFGVARGFELFGGIRQNWDDLDLSTQREVITATEPSTGVVIPFEDTSTDDSGEFKATTGEFGGKWFYNDNDMVYLKFARGYKPGTIQLLAGEDDLNKVEPEVLKMVEGGWRFGLANRSLLLNLTAFHYDYTDLQVSKIIITGQKLENAGAAIIDGVEAEIQWAPSATFFSQLAIGWLDARFKEFCGRDEELEDQATQAGCTDDQPHNFKGARMNDAPEFSVSLLARNTFGLGSFGSLTPLIKFTWVDDYSRRPFGNPIDDIDAYSKTDIRLVWASPVEKYKLEAFVENIEDHDDLFSHHFSMPDPGAYSLLGQTPPRVAGVKFSAEL